MPQELHELGELPSRQLCCIPQSNRGAVIVLYDLRAYTTPCEVRAGISVSDEAECWSVFVARRSGDLRHDVALLQQAHLWDAHLDELVTKEAQEVKLLLCRGVSRAGRVALGIDRDVAQEAT